MESLSKTQNDIDYTSEMSEFAQIKSDYLASIGISGFVFKKDSPSCGLERVKVYRENNLKQQGMDVDYSQ